MRGAAASNAERGGEGGLSAELATRWSQGGGVGVGTAGVQEKERDRMALPREVVRPVTVGGSAGRRGGLCGGARGVIVRR